MWSGGKLNIFLPGVAWKMKDASIELNGFSKGSLSQGIECVSWLLLAVHGETDKHREKLQELKRTQIQGVLVLKAKEVLSPRFYRWQTMLRLRNNFQASINLGHAWKT